MSSFWSRASPLISVVKLRRPQDLRRRICGRICRKELIRVFDEDLDDFVAELDVHDRRHGLLSRSKEGRAETNSDVRGRHLDDEQKKNYFHFLLLLLLINSIVN